MLRIRPINAADLDDLVDMAVGAGAGFTSLPPDAKFLSEKIKLSETSIAADVLQPGLERYLFVLEDDEGSIGGCCAIEAACGLHEPFYNYRVGLTVHASHELNVYNSVPTLYLSNDYTGSSVLCSLYLRPQFRSGGAGRLLSKCRFLFMANFPHRFADRVIAEMRGVSDEHGDSPFWEGLGRHFFSIDYDRAEHIVGEGNKACIAELMPKHPIYTVLLSPEARAVIGKVHPQTAPALHLLAQEGFRMQGYIDIFDGGPTVEAPRDQIQTMRHSRLVTARVGTPSAGGRQWLAANTRLADFRCTLADLSPHNDAVTVSEALAAVLSIADGDPLRIAALEPPR